MAFPAVIPGLLASGYGALRSWALRVDEDRRRLLERVNALEGRCARLEAFPAGNAGSPVRLSQRASVSADKTLSPYDVNRVLYISATANISLTLPNCNDGDWVTIVAIGTGSFTVTVKTPSGTTICSFSDGWYCHIPAVFSAGAPTWPTGVPTYNSTGMISTTHGLTINSTANVLTLLDSSGHYWGFTVNTEGAFVGTDNGLTGPV